MISLTATQGLDSHTSGAEFTRPGFRQNTAGDTSSLGYTDASSLGSGPRAFSPISGAQFANAGMDIPNHVNIGAAYGEELASRGADKQANVDDESSAAPAPTATAPVQEPKGVQPGDAYSVSSLGRPARPINGGLDDEEARP